MVPDDKVGEGMLLRFDVAVPSFKARQYRLLRAKQYLFRSPGVFRGVLSTVAMTLSSAKQPPPGPNWPHEIKHDGFRILARRDAKGVRF
ncbi:MAG TPA: hypothetical protein VGJ20_15215 [Xanthobacteraceae bacterium]